MQFEIQMRTGVETDEDGFTVNSGTVSEVLGAFEAEYPGAARGPAETMLRALGVTWDGYLNGEWTIGWSTPRGVVCCTVVEVAS